MYLAAFSVGELKAWTSTALPVLESNKSPLGKPITATQGSWLGSIIYLSAALACPFHGFVLQNWGRKMTGYFTVISLVIGWSFLLLSKSIAIFYVGRFLQGIGLSGTMIFNSIYVSEIAEDKIRGALVCLRNVFFMTGILVMYSLKSYLSLTTIAFVCMITPATFLLLFFWIPESPMYFMTKGLSEEAVNSYLWLRDGDTKKVEEEIKKLSLIVQGNNMNFKEVLAVRGTKKALYIIFILSIITQLSGSNVLLVYASKLFDISGSGVSTYTSTVIVGVILVLGSVASIFLADSLGRRILLMSSWTFQSAALIILGVYLFVKDLGCDVNAWKVLPVLCLSVFSFSFVAGSGSLIYLIAAEIFRPEARNLAANICCVNWLIGFLATRLHHDLDTVIGLHGCFWLYGSISIIGIIFTYYKLPETKNRSLESILRELNEDPSIDGASKIKR